MINEILIVVLLVVLLSGNVIILFVVNKKLREKPKQNFPKWEYYKEGLRFFNENNEVTIEHDKPLKK